MYKKYQMFLVLFIISFLSFTLMIPDRADSQPTVELVIFPEIETIYIGSESEKIIITARGRGTGLQFKWKLYGFGQLEREGDSDAYRLYVPPTEMKEQSTQAKITVTVTDDSGEEATHSVTFTLKNSTPPEAQLTGHVQVIVNVPDAKVYINDEYKGMAHPEQPLALQNIPVGQADVRVEAEEYLSAAKQIEVIPNEWSQVTLYLHNQDTIPESLRMARGYFNLTWYTTPPGSNAFDLYKIVLKIDSENKVAKDKIREMTNKYKALGEKCYKDWKKSGYDPDERKKAKEIYEGYLKVVQYRLNTLGDSVEEEIKLIQERLEAFDSPGHLRVSVDINNVKISVNDEYEDVAHLDNPAEYNDIPLGKVTVRVEAKGYKNETKEEMIHPNQWSEVNFNLRYQEIPGLMAEANKLFKLERFLTSDNSNSKVAFDIYKEVLEINPNYSEARKKISDMMKQYKTWGNSKYNRKKYKEAKTYYEGYLTIARYRLNTLGDRSKRREMEEIEKRLEKL